MLPVVPVRTADTQVAVHTLHSVVPAVLLKLRYMFMLRTLHSATDFAKLGIAAMQTAAVRCTLH